MRKFTSFEMILQLFLLLSVSICISAQSQSDPSVQPPRDADRLIARAREFWDHLHSNQKAKALQFVLEEKRDEFLKGQFLQLVEARVVGLDFSESPDRAVVRTSVKAFDGITLMTLDLTSPWVRRGNQWYSDVDSPIQLAGLFEGMAIGPRTLDADLNVPAVFDLGTIIHGRSATIKFPVDYAGNQRIKVDLLPKSSVVMALSEPLSLETRTFNLNVLPGSPVGDFTLPSKLRFYGPSAFVDREVVLKGRIFAPLAFRPDGDRPWRPGESIRFFIRNNTSEVVTISQVTPDLDGEVLEWPRALQPNEEAAVVYKPLTENNPERLDFVLEKPVFELRGASYTFRKAP